jgi:hypothetical protein
MILIVATSLMEHMSYGKAISNDHSIEVGIKKFKYAPDRSISSLISASLLHQIGLFFTRY